MVIEDLQVAPVAATAPSRPRRRRPSAFVLGVVGVVLFLLAWEASSRLNIVPSNQVPPASEILITLGAQATSAEFWASVGQTAEQWAIGLGVSLLISIPVGLLLGSTEIVWRAFRPAVEFFRTVPGNVLIPLAILLWGLSLNSVVFLIVFGCSWSLIVQTMYGAHDVDNGARDTARAFRLTLSQRVRWVLLPSALPQVATGLRIASATALIVAISAEILIGVDGLGKDIALSRTAGDVDRMYALIIASSALGILIHLLFTGIERYTLRWHESQRGEAS